MAFPATPEPRPYPSQLEDVGRFAFFALGASLTVILAFLGLAVRIPDDAPLAKSLVAEAILLTKFLGSAAGLELLRWLGFLDFGKPFRFQRLLLLAPSAVAFFAAVLAVVGIAAKMRATHSYREGQAFKKLAARNECAKKVAAELEKAATREGTARGVYARCLTDFDNSPKPMFGTTLTAEQSCKGRKAPLDAARAELRAMQNDAQKNIDNCIAVALAPQK